MQGAINRRFSPQQDAAGTILPPELVAEFQSRFPGCAVQTLAGARWGALLTPPAREQAPEAAGELRILLLGSFWIGHAALRAVLAHQVRYPGRVRLVGVVTDDPLSPRARISLRKRAWGLMPEGQRRAVKLALLRTALEAGVPVYTGEIKTPGFRRLLEALRPDAIITCGFGQVLDRPILEAVPYGAYNCHPTDLLNGHGAGPAPWDDMAARGVHHTVWSVHQMTEIVDAGPVIGQTPPINVGDAEGRLPPDNRAFFLKVLAPIGWMVLSLLEALLERRETGRPGVLTAVDIAGSAPPALCRRLLQPVAPDWQETPIPSPGEEEFAALRAWWSRGGWGAAAS